MNSFTPTLPQLLAPVRIRRQFMNRVVFLECRYAVLPSGRIGRQSWFEPVSMGRLGEQQTTR